MWQKFRKREEPIKIYKDKGEPAPDHLPRTAVDGVISWEPVSMHWKIIVSSSGNDAMLSVTARMSTRERGCKDVIVPHPPHPTPPYPTPHLETMPCWVWPQVCQRKERTSRTLLSHPTQPHPPASGDDAMLSVAARMSTRERSCKDVIVPPPPHPTPPYPPRIWRRCHVECGRKCVQGRNAAARTLFSHPTPPTPPHPTQPNPSASGEDAMLSVAASVTRILVSESRGWWLRNRLFLVAESGFLVSESAFFGCGIVFFWLRNRLFLVAEAAFFGCGSVYVFGCGIAEIWLRKRRNMVSESEFILISSWPMAHGHQPQPPCTAIFRGCIPYH